MIRGSLAGGLAVAGVGAALALSPGSAAADSFFLGYSSGHRHGQRHHHHRHHRHHHWPRYYYGYTYAPPVYYPPPPQVVYVPAAPPPLTAVPASPPYRTADGRYCREYQATVTVNGVPQPSYGTACLQPDGTWRVVN